MWQTLASEAAALKELAETYDRLPEDYKAAVASEESANGGGCNRCAAAHPCMARTMTGKMANTFPKLVCRSQKWTAS